MRRRPKSLAARARSCTWVHAWRDEAPPSLPTALTGEFSEARERWERGAAEVLEEQAKLAEIVGTAAAHLKKGRPAEETTDLAGELDAGLLVIGSRGLER